MFLSGKINIALTHWLQAVVRHPWLIISILLIISTGSLHYTANHLGVNTDTAEMLDAKLPFRQTFDRFRREFPTLANNLLVVIEAPTPEQARAATIQVKARLLESTEHFAAVDWFAGEPYFQQNGLLFLDPESLNQLGDQLSTAQPFLTRLADDMQSATLLELLTEAATVADSQVIELDNLLSAMDKVIQQLIANQPTALSWEQLFFNPSDGEQTQVYRETLIVEPHLDYSRVMAGQGVMLAADSIRADLGLQADQPVRMLLTGPVALEHEELLSALTGAKRAGIFALILVALVMYWGLRSVRLVSIALISLAIGFALTLGFAAWAVGRINLISIAFTVLYIGLGVNYGIHFMLRYREQLAQNTDRANAIINSAKLLAGALALSAITTAIGFFAFIPTSFSGVAELGLIAGVSMLITWVISYSLLPALLAVTPPPTIHTRRSINVSSSILDFPLKQRILVRILASTIAIGSLLLVTQLPFDSDPLNLRNPQSESVATLRLLLQSQSTGHRNLQVLADNAEAAQSISQQLRELPETDRVISVLDLIPSEQTEKLSLLEDIRWATGLDFMTIPEQLPTLNQQRLLEAMANLNDAMPRISSPIADSFQQSLQQLLSAVNQNPTLLTSFNHSLLGQLPAMLRQLQTALIVEEPVSSNDLPQHIRSRWVSEQGTYIVQIFPAGDTNDFGYVRQLIENVRQIAPQVTGMPVLQQRSGQAVSNALLQALIWALIGISLVLVMILRSVADSARVLVPLALGGLATGAILVLIGVPLNFANVVALPLLLGVAVDNGVHLVYRHRSGDMPTIHSGKEGNVLRTTTASGIIFGALTTVLSFGNLMFSVHTGTASMGLLLALGLSLMVTATLLVLPALLPKHRAKTSQEYVND